MARTITVDKPVTKEEDRLERVVLAARPDGSYTLRIDRQVLGKTASNEVVAVRRNPIPIERRSSQIQSESITITGGVTLTIPQIIEAFELLGDRWMAADEIERAKPPRPPPPDNRVGPPIDRTPPPRPTMTEPPAPAKSTRRKK